MRVVEVGGSVAGAYAAKLFADHGATVVKIEPPGGDPARAEADLFAYTNTGKLSAVLDLCEQAGTGRLERILRGADVLIEGSAPEPLEPIPLDLPHLVRVTVSPFGTRGPYAGYRSTDFTDFALSGHMHVNGDPDRPPLQGPPHESEYMAGSFAFVAAMAALIARARSGLGQTVDVSHVEAMAAADPNLVPMWTHGGFRPPRPGNASLGPGYPNAHFACLDGEVSVCAGDRDRRDTLLHIAGLGELADGSSVPGPAERERIGAALGAWFGSRTTAEAVELLQAVRIPAAPVRGICDALGYDHLRDRGFWQYPEGCDGAAYPRGPFVVAGHPVSLRAAPAVGDTELGELLRWEQSGPSAGAARAPGAAGGAPLEGLKVLDLGSGWAGPMCSRILADLGADVVRLEPPWGRGPSVVSEEYARASHLYPDDRPGVDPWNREGMASLWGRNRRTVCVRVDLPAGRRVLESLVEHCEVMVENFSPRVMANLGLGYERLRSLNPSLVYAHLPGFGTTGPDAMHVSLGPTAEAASGMCSLSGYPDRGRHRQALPFADAVSGVSGAAGVLVALWHRASDPLRRSLEVEGAQLEATLCFVGDALLAAGRARTEPERRGNRHPVFAPQGCYPAAGADRWVALTVRDEGEWRRLCRLAGLPARMRDLPLAARRAAHDDIDRAISTWTAGHPGRNLMEALQSEGIAAATVTDARDVVEDPHLEEREFFRWLGRPGYGPFPCSGLPLRFGRTPASYRIANPGLGEHNDEVLAEIGWPPEEVAGLRASGVLCDRPPSSVPPA